MPTFIALLRGINLAGRHKVSMSDVRTLFADHGATEVVTYIQSGNVVFDHSARAARTLAADLERALGEMASFAVPVILRTAKEWSAAVEANPFPQGEGTTLVATFLADRVPRTAIPNLDRADYAPEEFEIVGREVYMYLPNGFARATLNKLLAPVTKHGTARNWNTVLRLQELAARR